MRRKIVSVVALAIATGFTGTGAAAEADPEPASPESGGKPEARPSTYLAPAALIAAGVAAVAALAGSRGGGGGNAGSTSGSTASGASSPPRALTYTSAADFQTPEYNAQSGLAWVRAASLYYNGHYRWFTGDAPSSAAGTGIGVKIAVADTGINAREATTGSAIAIDVS